MNGQVLCNLGKERFLELAPDFVGDILWEHLEQMIKGTCRGTGRLPVGKSRGREERWGDLCSAFVRSRVQIV